MEPLIDEFLKAKSYERTTKRVQVPRSLEKHDLQSFMIFLRERRKLRQISQLSFALNLETQTLKFAARPMDLVTKSTKRKLKVLKKDIPEKFIKHILSLGFQETEGQVLYENKDDWMGFSTGKLEYK